jgi:FMN reductase
VYRASYATPLKTFLDRLPRGRWGETEAPITARAIGMVMTGATWQHYLAVDALRNVLAGFFAAHVLAPGLYVPGDGFTEARTLAEPFAELAHAQGAAIVALAEAIAGAPSLGGVTPQV